MTRSLVLKSVAVLAAVMLARTALKWDAGLRAEYIADTASGAQGHTGVDRDVSTAAIARAWKGAPPERFRARWTGYLVVARAGAYTFATTSDDGSAVAIDGARVVDNSGEHGSLTRTGRVDLQRGSHQVLIDYSQAGGLYELTLSWAPEGGTLSPVPAWALWTRRTSAWRALATRIIDPLFLAVALAAGVILVRAAWETRGRAVVAAVRERWHEWRRRPARAQRLVNPRAVFRLLLPLLSLIVALLVAELSVRMLFRTVRSSGDARTFFAARNEEPPRVNNLGYRDVDVHEKSQRFRIVVMGDSITWGAGLPDAERFANLLQRFLGSDYEVVNFGIPGRGMPDHLAALDQALSIAPDFILLQLYTNDFEIGGMERPRAKPLLPWPGVDGWLLQSSAVYTMLSAQWPGIQEKLGWLETYEHYMFRYLGDPHSPESVAAFGMLRDLIARTRQAGVPVGTVMFPNPGVLSKDYAFAYLHDRVRSVCEEENIHCIDLREPFLSSFTDLKDIVVSAFDGHPSARASLVAADQILADFRPLWQPCSMRPADTSCQPQPHMTEAPAKPKPDKPARRPSRRRARR